MNRLNESIEIFTRRKMNHLNQEQREKYVNDTLSAPDVRISQKYLNTLSHRELVKLAVRVELTKECVQLLNP